MAILAADLHWTPQTIEALTVTELWWWINQVAKLHKERAS